MQDGLCRSSRAETATAQEIDGQKADAVHAGRELGQSLGQLRAWLGVARSAQPQVVGAGKQKMPLTRVFGPVDEYLGKSSINTKSSSNKTN